jgi:hypothetical protein
MITTVKRIAADSPVIHPLADAGGPLEIAGRSCHHHEKEILWR